MDELMTLKGIGMTFKKSGGFLGKERRIEVLKDIDLTINRGEIIAVVGESGCGKTTLGKIITGLYRPTSGEVFFEGNQVSGLFSKKINSYNSVQFVQQDSYAALNPVRTIYQSLYAPIKARNKKWTRSKIDERIDELMTLIGLQPASQFLTKYPHQLSGGLRQRVMIAMAMICNPELMIADEPTTALDVTIEAQILYLMNQLQKEVGTAVIMITHNLGVVAESCDYVYVMYAGKIMEEAPVKELFKNPLHPYTFGLMNSIPKMTEVKTHLYTIKGMVPNLLNLPQGCRFCPRCDKAMKICTMYQPDLYELEDGHKVRCFLYNKEVMESGK